MPEPITTVKLTKIDHVVILGDSLSDRGAMNERRLLGVIPGGLASGLTFKSNTGRFTNGLVWGDYFAEKIVKSSVPTVGSAPFAAGVNLDDSDEITAPWSTNFMRTYCEGGLTAHDYAGIENADDLLHPLNQVTQEMLSCLDTKRKIFLEDDAAMCITLAEKQSTLVIEWSGANDLITVNSSPTVENAEKAILARIQNVEALIAAGYRNFALFNLPDLSLTPRFQNGEESARSVVKEVSMHFNKFLAVKVAELQTAHPDCNIGVHDVNGIFSSAYQDPAKYGLDPEKLRTPLVDSADFKLTAVGIGADSTFFDDVHPSTKVHEVLEEDFYKNYFKRRFEFVPPVVSHTQKFREAYGKKWADEKRHHCCSFWRSPSLKKYKETDLLTAYQHAQKKGKGIAHEVFEELKKRKELSEDLLKPSSARGRTAQPGMYTLHR